MLKLQLNARNDSYHRILSSDFRMKISYTQIAQIQRYWMICYWNVHNKIHWMKTISQENIFGEKKSYYIEWYFFNESKQKFIFIACVCFFFLRHRHQNYRFESLALVSLSVDKTCFGFVQLTSIPWRDSLQMIRMSKNFIFIIATVIFCRYHSAIYFYTFLKMYIPYSIFHTVTDNCSIHFQTPKSLWSVAES